MTIAPPSRDVPKGNAGTTSGSLQPEQNALSPQAWTWTQPSAKGRSSVRMFTH